MSLRYEFIYYTHMIPRCVHQHDVSQLPPPWQAPPERPPQACKVQPPQVSPPEQTPHSPRSRQQPPQQLSQPQPLFEQHLAQFVGGCTSHLAPVHGPGYLVPSTTPCGSHLVRRTRAPLSLNLKRLVVAS